MRCLVLEKREVAIIRPAFYRISMYVDIASRCRAFSASSLSLFIVLRGVDDLSFFKKPLSELDVEVDFIEEVSECNDFSDAEGIITYGLLAQFRPTPNSNTHCCVCRGMREY